MKYTVSVTCDDPMGLSNDKMHTFDSASDQIARTYVRGKQGRHVSGLGGACRFDWRTLARVIGQGKNKTRRK